MNDDDIPEHGSEYPHASIIAGRILGILILAGVCALVAWAIWRAR